MLRSPDPSDQFGTLLIDSAGQSTSLSARVPFDALLGFWTKTMFQPPQALTELEQQFPNPSGLQAQFIQDLKDGVAANQAIIKATSGNIACYNLPL